jgi:hypothetical protein
MQPERKVTASRKTLARRDRRQRSFVICVGKLWANSGEFNNVYYTKNGIVTATIFLLFAKAVTEKRGHASDLILVYLPNNRSSKPFFGEGN